MRIPTATELDGYVSKHISTICGNSYTNDADNHCAHFACHITELSFGGTCFGMTSKGDKSKRANIRVQEVFQKCRRVGKWADKPADLRSGFIFVIKPGNVDAKKKIMSNVSQKHLGIFIEEHVWQYKNKFKQVVKQTPTEFSQHYGGTGFEIFFGEFPL